MPLQVFQNETNIFIPVVTSSRSESFGAVRTSPLDIESEDAISLAVYTETNEEVLRTLSLPLPIYEVGIRKALQKMGLQQEHLEMWEKTHSPSALQYIRFMSEENQRKVAHVALYIRSVNKNIDPKTIWREAAALVHYSRKYGLELSLAVAIAQTESTFNPNAVSYAGALGVMQVMWRVHEGLLRSHGIIAQEQMFDPEKGIAAGCLLLSRYLRAYGDVQLALNRYYGGLAVAYKAKVDRYIARLDRHSEELGL